QALAAARLEDLADGDLALAVAAVAVGRVNVGDAEIERVTKNFGALFRAVADEAAAAAEGEDRHLRACAAERPHGHARGRVDERNGRAERRRSEKIAPGNRHYVLSWEAITNRQPDEAPP